MESEPDDSFFPESSGATVESEPVSYLAKTFLEVPTQQMLAVSHF